MKKLRAPVLLAVAVLGFFLALPCAAQDSPAAFAGSWTLDLAKSKLDKRFPIKGQTLVITFKDPSIEFQYNTDDKPFAVTFTIDGKEYSTPNPAMKGYTVLKATWKKSVLDTQNMSSFGPGMTSMFLEEHWSLSPDGKTLSRKTGSDFDSAHLYVYARQ